MMDMVGTERFPNDETTISVSKMSIEEGKRI